MNRALAFAGALLALACQAPPDTSVDATGDSVLLEACEAAAGRWEAATGIVVGCDSGRPVQWGQPKNECAAATTMKRRVVVATLTPVAQEDLVHCEPGDARPEGLELELYVLHEIGHVLTGRRPEHAPGGSVMAPRATTYDAPITEADLVWLCSKADCRWMAPE